MIRGAKFTLEGHKSNSRIVNPPGQVNKPCSVCIQRRTMWVGKMELTIAEKSGGTSKMKYVRVYADANGESHFEDVKVEFNLADFAPPALPLNISDFMPTSQMGFLRASPGWYGDWHPAPRRQFIIYLAGESEAEVSDGEIRHFGPGSVTLVEDTWGKGHQSRAVSSCDVQCVVVQLVED